MQHTKQAKLAALASVLIAASIFGGLSIAPALAQQAVAAQAGISVAQLQAVLANPALNPDLARAYSNALTTASINAAGGMATIDVDNAVQAQREYAEDIRMYGFSFNTTIGEASVFGELAYRPNLPIGIATTNDLLGDLLIQSPQLASGATVNIGGQDVKLGDQIHNVERVEAFNASLGTIYNFGPSLSFDSLIGVAELASAPPPLGATLSDQAISSRSTFSVSIWSSGEYRVAARSRA